MKIIAAPAADFASYIARPDTVFIEREGGTLEGLYGQGYLPYSSSKNIQNVFYSARNARIVLPEFTLNSENRRIAKKFDGQFNKQRVAFADFNADETFFNFVLEYFINRHGENTMPRERLELILHSELLSSCLIYKTETKVVGYVLEGGNGAMRHYWYSAYDTELAQQSLGMWLMLDSIRDAAADGIKHYYLGTVYGPKALYKTNFAPLEWWDGETWSRDIAKLKDLSRAEA